MEEIITLDDILVGPAPIGDKQPSHTTNNLIGQIVKRYDNQLALGTNLRNPISGKSQKAIR